VQNLLEKATQKSHRIDSELTHVESQMEPAP
jgi:hypothetical protein